MTAARCAQRSCPHAVCVTSMAHRSLLRLPRLGLDVDARTWGGDALMHEPPLLFQYTMGSLPIDDDPIRAAQQSPQSPTSKDKVLLNPLPQPLRPRRVSCLRRPAVPSMLMRAGAAHPEHLTAPPFWDNRQRAIRPSHVFRSKRQGFNASHKILLSRARSPILCFSFLICSSFTASWSRGRLRRAFSARVETSPASLYVRAASSSEVSPFRILTTSSRLGYCTCLVKEYV